MPGTRSGAAPAALVTLAAGSDSRGEPGASRRSKHPGLPGRKAGHRRRQGSILAPVPRSGQAELRLLARVGIVDPGSLEDYQRHGGYRALPRTLAIGREAAIAEIPAAGLLGRGGAGFPTGRKWTLVRLPPARPTTSSATPTRASPAPSRTGSSWREIPHSAVVEAMPSRPSPIGADARRPLRSRGVSEAEALVSRAIAAARAAGLWCATSWAPAWSSTSSCGEAPAPTSAARRRPSSPRSKVTAASPATSRPIPFSRALRQADRGQQRRDARQRAAHPGRGGRGGGLPRHRHGRVERPQAVLPVRARGATGRLRGALRDHACASSSTRPAACPATAPSGPCCSAVWPARSSGRRRSRRRSPSRARVPSAPPWARASSWSSTRRSTCSARCAASPPSSVTSRAASACPAGSAPSARWRSSTASATSRTGLAHPRGPRRAHHRPRPGHARRVDLRPRPDRLGGHRVRPAAARDGGPVTESARGLGPAGDPRQHGIRGPCTTRRRRARASRAAR